jgi:ketosteroid isomerase-like protein
MLPEGLADAMEQDHRALNALVTGDPEPKKQMFSRRPDVTLANPLGLPARGWNEVEATLERAAAQLRDGEPHRFERISEYASADLAYIVEIERSRAKLAGSDRVTAFSLRVTTIFRREEDAWRIAHRHADPITSSRPMESIAESR